MGAVQITPHAIQSSANQRDLHVSSAVDSNIGEIVPRLLKRFSSREGYKLFDDTLPTRTCATTAPSHDFVLTFGPSNPNFIYAGMLTAHSSTTETAQRPHRSHQQHRWANECVLLTSSLERSRRLMVVSCT